MRDQTRPSTAVAFASDDNVPSTRLKNLAASHRVQVLDFLLVPETLARDILHSVCDLTPRVQIQPLGVIIAPPDLAATEAAESAARSRARWHIWVTLESVQGLDDIERGPKTGGWCVLVTCYLSVEGVGVVRTGPPLGTHFAVTAIRTVIHRSNRAHDILRRYRGMRRPVFVEIIHVIGVRVIELLVDLLDGAVKDYGRRCIAGDRLDGPGEVNHAVFWVGGRQNGG